MKLTRQISRQVRNTQPSSRSCQSVIIFIELDALQFETEEEGPSYLADLDKVPEFVDEPPTELTEVCNHPI
jgi:hypothetical protein